MQILARPHNDKVGVPQVDVCIRGFKGVCCAVCIHTHGRIHSLHVGATWVPRSGRFGVLYTDIYICIYMYTYMYILYMQVFDRCHAVTKLVFAEVSVYIYMYLQVSTVHLYTHV